MTYSRKLQKYEHILYAKLTCSGDANLITLLLYAYANDLVQISPRRNVYYDNSKC